MPDFKSEEALKALSKIVDASGYRAEKHNILMEYAAGNSINTMYCDYYDDDRQFSLPLILDVALQSALAIKELHDKGLLHRDIKGGNLIYDFFLNKASIVDFGEVVEMKNGFFADKKQVGTDSYWAPEILNKDKNPRIHYSPKSDVYAFGVMLD